MRVKAGGGGRVGVLPTNGLMPCLGVQLPHAVSRETGPRLCTRLPPVDYSNLGTLGRHTERSPVRVPRLSQAIVVVVL